jgi:protein-glutamine gamma-glutamyltransferase
MSALNQRAVFASGAAAVIAVLPNLLWMPAWVSAIVLLALVWRVLVDAPPRLPRPPTLLRFTLTVAVVVYVLFEFRTLLGRQAGITLLTLMLALKFLETSTRRDALLTVTLSYFVTACHGLVSQSMATTAYMLLAAVVITLCLRVLNATEQRSEFALGPTAAIGFSVKRVLRALVIPVLHAVPLAMVFFLFVPRLGTPVFGVPEDSLEARTGLSEEMEPGGVSKLYIDDSPVFRVRFDGTPPAQSQMYWRGPVLWNFDGRRWTSSWGYSRIPFADFSAVVRAETSLRYEVVLEPTDRNWLFALDVATSAPEGALVSRDFQLLSRKPVNTLKRYMQTSDMALLGRIRDDSSRVNALAQPPDRNVRAQALARQWRSETSDPRALVERALSMFRDDEFFYTLEPQTLGANPVDEFLFETREGYCEHYASAFVSLMRAAGVPARVVTGYQGAIFNRSGGYWVVRQSDAHAWSEVFIDGAGWQRVDPTSAVSPDRINRGTDAALRPERLNEPTWLKNIRSRYDFVQDFWNRSVLAFNEARQRSLLEPFGVPDLDWRGSAAMLVAALLLTALVVFATLAWRHRQRAGDPLAESLLRFRRALERQRFAAPAAEAPLALKQRLLAAGAARDVANYLDALHRARYAQSAVGDDDIARVKALHTIARRSLRKHPLRSLSVV